MDKAEQITNLMESIFKEDFITNAGTMALFSILKLCPDPMEGLDHCFKFWRKQKDDHVQNVLKFSVEVQNNPEKYSEVDLAIYEGIEQEEYQMCANKALAQTQKVIKEEFERFLEIK